MSDPVGGGCRVKLSPQGQVSESRYLIGLAGNIATGKSTVAAMLAERGATVIDADKVVHQIMRPGSKVFDQIISAVQGMTGKVKDAVAGIIPTVESPTEPSVPAEPVEPGEPSTPPIETPLPTPTPLPPDAPDPEVPVDITPSPDEVGVDGGSNIDLTPSTGF